MPGLSDIVQLLQEDYTTYALKSDGSVWVWGQHGFGERHSWFNDKEPETGYWPWQGAAAETSPAPSQSVPTQIAGLPKINQLATMWVYERDEQNYEGVSVFALHADGGVSAWGRNNYGQLGDGSREDRWTPVVVDGLQDATALVVVYQSVFALKADGTVWAWGENYRGRLGDGTMKDRKRPVEVRGLSDIESIHLHRGTNGGLLALRRDGTLWTCGSLADIGLVDEDPSRPEGPHRVPGLSNVTQVLSDGPTYLLARGHPPPRAAEPPEEREGCYIATAVYGDYEAPAVVVLRRFRDESLASSAAGRAFIRIYYRLSPALAQLLGSGTPLTRGARRSLDFLVKLLDRRVSSAPSHRSR
ncbi:RCC1 domain-containing protein [Nocardioides ginkgobilobae]